MTRRCVRVAALALLLTAATISEPRRVRAADPFPTPWVLGMIGLTQGQTIRLNVVNLVPPSPPTSQIPPGPCRVVLSFLDAGGQPFTDSNGQAIQSEVELQRVGISRPQRRQVCRAIDQRVPARLQLRPVVHVLQQPRGFPPGPCFPTMEVFDNDRTHLDLRSWQRRGNHHYTPTCSSRYTNLFLPHLADVVGDR